MHVKGLCRYATNKTHGFLSFFASVKFYTCPCFFYSSKIQNQIEAVMDIRDYNLQNTNSIGIDPFSFGMDFQGATVEGDFHQILYYVSYSFAINSLSCL